MNSKKLARLFYAYIGVVVLIALFLLYFQQQQKKKTQNMGNPNVVTKNEDAEAYDKTDIGAQKVINIKTVISESNKEIVKTESDDTLSYFEVYQQLQSARACEVFYRFWREQGLSADVASRVSRPHYFYGQQVYSGDEQVPLSGGQVETLNYWVRQCYQLWADYGVFDNSKTASLPMNDVREAITQKLLTIAPVTNKEKALKNTRRLAVQWTNSFEQLEAAYEGEDSLEATAARALYDELENLQTLDDEIKSQWFAAQRNNHPGEESLRDQHFDLLRQIRALEQRIKSQKVPNQEKLEAALVDFQSFDQVMNNNMKTEFGDVVFEIVYALSGRQAFLFQYLGFEHAKSYGSKTKASQHRITPDQLMYAASGFENPTLHQWDIRYAMHLHLCDLGWDCGPQSPIIMNYCLFGLGSYPDACGQELQSFYNQYYISPSRLPDVLRFKSVYIELFDE
ncbi:MAG: hypothetical protein AB8B80_08115 [Marinicellaceae bacterium]